MPTLTHQIASCCAAAAFAIAADGDRYGNAMSTVMLQTERSWDGQPYKQYPDGEPQLTMLKIVIPAHSTLPWHVHPVPNAAYVLSGTIHVESRDGHHRTTLHAGDVLPEMVGTEHRGWTEGEPAQLIVFYAGAKGVPLAIKTQ
ncbi:quercetin dioxygenase-like cupin family protein [Burkholderia ambifaria]|nr:cupin domain-containing protein [Burkholderia ambifaria]MDR6504031.1 quercetin dioxygenase-like cupin family protein [Burkholderia ambifaria]